MSKIITQETFNDVVRENIEEFDMGDDEAISEAIEQFEAQGVNLSNIIKNPQKAKEIVANVEKLRKLSEEIDMNNASEILRAFSDSIRGDIGYKLLAAKDGSYEYLINILKKAADELKVDTIEALTQLMDGHPDLLNEEGLNLLLRMLNCDSAEISVASLKLLLVSVTKHEKNRSSLIRGGVGEKLRLSIERWPDNKDVISGVCAAVEILIQDDDVRVVHGDAHEHARALATALLPLLAAILSKCVDDVDVTTKLLSALTSMIVRNEFCIQFYENDGLRPIMEAMIQHSNDQKCVRNSFLLIKNLAGSDEVKEPIITAGAAPLVVATLERHHKCKEVAVAGCLCIAALSLRSPQNARALNAAEGAETLVRCMTYWKQNLTIMRHGCAAIRNQISRCPDLKEEYLQLQVDQLLLENKANLEFEAKSVLVDLGCDVKLTEEWRGTGVQLTN